jgi:hypothetical protein
MKPKYTSITFSNCQLMKESYAGQGGVLFVSQPFISVYLNKVKISKPTAISGGVAFVENAFRVDIIDS